MAAATAGYEWSHSSPTLRQHSSPDTTSPMYPDRPIRPMPKRRIRSRLSPEQASTIPFPPTPSNVQPLFTFPYGSTEKTPVPTRHSNSEHSQTCHCGADHSDLESEEEEDPQDYGPQSSPIQFARQGFGGRGIGTASQRSAKGVPPASTSPSADGYESFENTNNKKKRKIPANGAIHTNLSAEMASMGISPEAGDHSAQDDPSHYAGGNSLPSAPGSGTGISGAGRGRFGRPAARGVTERRPLGSSTNGLNAYNGVPGKGRDRWEWSGSQISSPEQGIISTAIANAAVGISAGTSPTGSENVSLLQQEASKTPPQKTQFTFTCESDSATKMVWPGQIGDHSIGMTTNPTAPHATNRRVATHGTQTSPHMNGTQQGNMSSQSAAQIGSNSQGAPLPAKPRRRRTPSREYALADRQRRLQQEYNNYHNPPSREDIWICEFCEYQAIFGTQPEALIRRYERNDRKARKREAEKRRLLEKAKMKGRKGKKGKKAKEVRDRERREEQVDEGIEGEDYDEEYDDGVGVPVQSPQVGHVHQPESLCLSFLRIFSVLPFSAVLHLCCFFA
ncbi:hypothetical protein M501DRAFT_526271 [Patellaria atrata CBS 101060]|uniref:Uncharacterized protein n=1 Tax=Patellaria atrata CBS 101060 TaxID=1346257 RepID=A0A9P4SEJ0_9PEZI|nr:hypothetical protein M501DRAFT_526271 [Patellaria atrata CBS 101060]